MYLIFSSFFSSRVSCWMVVLLCVVGFIVCMLLWLEGL